MLMNPPGAIPGVIIIGGGAPTGASPKLPGANGNMVAGKAGSSPADGIGENIELGAPTRNGPGAMPG